jgi:hypothetical protein
VRVHSRNDFETKYRTNCPILNSDRKLNLTSLIFAHRFNKILGSRKVRALPLYFGQQGVGSHQFSVVWRLICTLFDWIARSNFLKPIMVFASTILWFVIWRMSLLMQQQSMTRYFVVCQK